MDYKDEFEALLMEVRAIKAELQDGQKQMLQYNTVMIIIAMGAFALLALTLAKLTIGGGS